MFDDLKEFKGQKYSGSSLLGVLKEGASLHLKAQELRTAHLITGTYWLTRK